MTPWRTSETRTRERGVVLALVLILGLLLSASIITFSRRAVVDSMIVRNREDAASAEALARGGLRIATAVLVVDQLAAARANEETPAEDAPPPGDTLYDLWSQLEGYPLVTPDGASLQITIQDSGGRLNLNAVVPYTGEEVPADPQAAGFLEALIEKVIDDMEIPPADRAQYPADELAENLIDYMDLDTIRPNGAPEDDPGRYTAANGPLLSVEQLGLVEGFDVQLMNAMRPYVTVHPIVGASGINLNTAPPHVLALLYHQDPDWNLAKPETVQRILKQRADGRIICTNAEASHEDCISLLEGTEIDSRIFPEVDLPSQSESFTVTARAAVGDVERTLVAVVDRSLGDQPQVLSWRMQ